MKKYLLALAIVVFIVVVLVFTSHSGNGSTKNYANNTISFNYPTSWGIATQNSSDNRSIVAVGDAAFRDNSTTGGNGVIINKIPLNTNTTVELAALMDTYDENGTAGTISIAGVNANETTFNVTTNNATAQIMVIDFEKNNFIYLIRFITIDSNFKKQSNLFNTITRSLSVP